MTCTSVNGAKIRINVLFTSSDEREGTHADAVGVMHSRRAAERPDDSVRPFEQPDADGHREGGCRECDVDETEKLRGGKVSGWVRRIWQGAYQRDVCIAQQICPRPLLAPRPGAECPGVLVMGVGVRVGVGVIVCALDVELV